jgi:RHS repeat-associated protein
MCLWEKSTNEWRSAFVTAPQPLIASRENAWHYDGRASGAYQDRETNLAYNYFRDYDPAIGRYERSDPIGLKGGLNTYVYVRGNPTSRFDQFGLTGVIIGPGGIPMPVPAPPPGGAGSGSGSGGKPRDPGNPFDGTPAPQQGYPTTQQDPYQPGREIPPPPPACVALMEKCLDTCNTICPTPGFKQGCYAVCFALSVICQAITGNDPGSSGPGGLGGMIR